MASWLEQGRYIGDSATFPRLPAKDLIFTLMANAFREVAALLERRQSSCSGSAVCRADEMNVFIISLGEPVGGIA